MIKLMEFMNLIEKKKCEFLIGDSQLEEKSAYISAIYYVSEITDFNKIMEQIRKYIDEGKIVPYIDCMKGYEHIVYYLLKENLLKDGSKNKENIDIRILIKDSIIHGDYIWIFGLPYGIVINISYDAAKEPRYSYFEDISIYNDSDHNHITMLSDFFTCLQN